MVENKAETKKEKMDTEENQKEENVEEMEQSEENIDGKNEAAKPKEDDEAPFDINELLNQTVKLADGTEAKVFSYGPKTLTAGVRPLNCHLCRISNIWKKEIQKKHVSTNRHQNNLKRESIDPEKFNKPLRQYYGKKDDVNLKFIIYPGDNISEVLEEHKEQERVFVTEEVKFKKPNSEVLAELKEDKINEYNTKMPLLGLEYIFKMQTVKKDIKRVTYYCALCGAGAVADGYLHLASAFHQAGYIIKHFPGFYKVVQKNLNGIKNDVAREQAIRNVFRKLYRKIENSKGLKKFQIIDHSYFQQHRDECIKICRNNIPHYDEKTIPISNQEVEALCKKALKGVNFIKQDLISLKKPELGYRRMVDPNGNEDGRPQRGRDRDEPPTKRRNLGSRSGNMSAAWQTYRVMVGNVLDEINDTYKRFEVEPKTHPHYDSEWQSFWRRRCQELKRERKDPRYHDFEAEWAPFWLQRLRNLYTKDLARRKHEMKRMLDLPFDMGSPSPIRQNVGSDQQFMNAPQALQQQQPAFITPNIFQDQPMRNVMENVPMIPAEPLSVISVMRLLSALEEQLGSLGPKAVQLLSRAVLVEKDNGHTDSLLINNDYYVFFATVKEKFKGQILARVVDPTKLEAINNVIEEINGIIALMDKSLAIERRKQQQMQLKQQRMKTAKLAAQGKSQTLEAPKTDNAGNWQAGAIAGNVGGNNDAGGNNRRKNRKRGRRDSKAGVGVVAAIENEGPEPGNNTASVNDNFNRNAGGGNDNLNRNTGGGNDNFNRNTGGNFNRNAGGGNDNFNRNMNTVKDNFNRNTGGGNDNFNRNSGGGNDNFNRNSGADNLNRGSGGNDNFNRNSGGNFGNAGNDNRGGYGSGGNAGRNYGSGGNDNTSRNFGGNLDNNSRNLGGGNKDNYSRNFGNSGNFDRDFNDSGRGNAGTNLSNRNYDNFEKSFGGNDNNRNFGNDNFNRNDNASRNYGGGNDNYNRNNDDYGRNYGSGSGGNNSSRNDFGNKNFGNSDNYGRNSLMGNDNFGRSFDSGNNNNRSNFGTNSGGGANNSLGSNMGRSNSGGGIPSLSSLGGLGGLGSLGNTGRNFSSGGGGGGGNDSGRNFGSGGFGGGNFSSGGNFNRSAGFSRNY